MTRVVHVITGLLVGGAEVMLARLLSAFDETVENHVVSLAAEGPMAAVIRAQGVPVLALGLSSGPSALAGLPRLVGILRELRPDVVHTWMYHADLLGGLAARMVGVPVVWALHNTTLDPAKTGRAVRGLVRTLALLSRTIPTQIVSCSEVGRRVHESIGYDSGRLVVIPNGFDTTKFRPDPKARSGSRETWGASEDDIVVGHLARFHPQKDHFTLLAAAGVAAAVEPRLRFVFYGREVTHDNPSLVQWARDAGVLERCSFLGEASELESRIPGFDLLVSASSFGEAFPLVIGEAMSCGVPCVATDVGDSTLIVGDTGMIVPPRDAGRLANALVELAHWGDEKRLIRAQAARARIVNFFSLAEVAQAYQTTYRGVRLKRPAFFPDADTT